MKKTYQTPSINIVQLKTTTIICTSTMGIRGEANSSTVVESRRRSIWDDDISGAESRHRSLWNDDI